MNNRLRIALQKSGRLSDESFSLLRRCGITLRVGNGRLVCCSDNFPLEVLLVRDDDIPQLIAEGTADIGVVGNNVLAEYQLRQQITLSVVRDFKFGYCRLSLAVPNALDYQGLESLQGLKVATSYPQLLRNFAAENQVVIEVETLSGSVEIAPKLGLADAICDLVSTGATLEANELTEVATILQSRAQLIANNKILSPQKQCILQQLLQRIEGVEIANEAKYIMLHAPKARLEQVVRLLPGVETPSVMTLEGDVNRVGLHAVCRETIFWETLESLKAVGASSILVLPVEKMMV